MSKEELVHLDGEVILIAKGGNFRVKLDNGHEVLAKLAGKVRRHRIRVEISSSYFPLYLRNLNTGADNIGLETSTVVAEQKVMHTAAQPSRIVLPVIPRR